MAALRVEGVTAVANDLSVHMPYRSTRSDRQITAAIRINSRCLTAPCPKMPPRAFRRLLNAVPAFDAGRIRVSIESNKVILRGAAVSSSRRTAS